MGDYTGLEEDLPYEVVEDSYMPMDDGMDEYDGISEDPPMYEEVLEEEHVYDMPPEEEEEMTYDDGVEGGNGYEEQP